MQSTKLWPKPAKAPPKDESKLTPEMRKEIEAACARRDVEFLRQSFASNNQAVSEYAERFLEQVVEQMRSERDHNDALFIKKKLSPSGEAEPEQNDAETKAEP
jgi:thioesterase domain-containing protein